ncbi:hypothetical protein M2678_002248 [Staphylococcus pseudintermedius]|nr:hypothetical protein [Staphylococcus pseudintermedius]
MYRDKYNFYIQMSESGEAIKIFDAIDAVFYLTCPHGFAFSLFCKCFHQILPPTYTILLLKRDATSPIIKRAFLKSVLLSRKALMLIAY